MEKNKRSAKKAVALVYPEGVEAPIIAAKGTGKKAEKILEVAAENNITVKEDVSLVDFLGLQDEGSLVPPEAWEVLAEIFSVIIKTKDNKND